MASDNGTRFGILGALEIVDPAGREVKLGGAAQRRLLAALLVHANSMVPSERLEHLLDLTPGGLRTAVSRLRRLVGSDALLTEPPGYVLRTDALDADRFERMIDDARRAPAGERIGHFDAALAMWRGDALAEFSDEWWAQPVVVRLGELRAAACEDRAEALLAVGRWSDAVAAMESHVVDHPLRDRPRGLLMRALAADGRQAEALRVYQRYRTFLGEEIGTEPSDELRGIEAKIATGWRDRPLPVSGPAGSAGDAAPRSGPITVLFTDIEESTARWEADADAMAASLDRHDRVLLAAVERQSGAIVKHTGDGIMAAFAEPGAALRAALDAQLMLGEAFDDAGGLRVRIGVHTGVAMARGGDYIGRTVNRASRIANAAGGGQILCSATSADLARDQLPPTVELVDVGPRHLRGIPGVERHYSLHHPDLAAVNAGPGRVIHGIRFGERVSVDLLGEVWSGTLVESGDGVVVRVTSIERLEASGFAPRFELDSHLLMEMDHPNVERVLDAWHDRRGAYLVTPRPTGATAQQLLEEGRFGRSRAVSVISQVADALHAAHGRRLVHGNVCSSSVRLDDDGVAIVTDFAVGGAFRPDAPYAAPELRSSGDATVDSDVYALGAVAHELLRGYPPPLDASAPDQATNGSDPGSAADVAIQRALSPRPLDRPRTPLELAGAVEDAFGYASPRRARGRSAADAEPPMLPVGLRDPPRFGFAGREPELAEFEASWREALGGRPRLVVVRGEPGIGKTTLLAEAARRAHAAGAHVLHGRCDDGVAVPYQPFSQALRHLLRCAAPDQAARELDDPRSCLAPAECDPEDGFADPLGTAAEEHARLADAVASWLTSASARTPLFLAIDDVHRADPGLLALIRHLFAGSSPDRLLVGVTVRDCESGSVAADLVGDARRDPHARVLDIGGLATEQIDRFLAAATTQAPMSAPVPDEIVEAIQTETRGNPLFVTELVLHLAETGVLGDRGTGWKTTTAVSDLGIPETVREVVERRVASLSRTAADLLPAAAVLGPDIEPGLWQALAQADDDDFVAGVEELLGTGLVQERSDLPPVYGFSHAIVQSTIHQGISAVRRSRLHYEAGIAIEREKPERLDELANHFAAGAGSGDPDRALSYARRAADAATGRRAYPVAARHLTTARKLVDAFPIELDPSEYIDLLVATGTAQRRAGDPQFRATLIEAARRAEAEGFPDRLAAAALANKRSGYSVVNRVDEERVRILRAALDTGAATDDGTRAVLLSRIALELTHSASLEERTKLSDEAVGIARATGDRQVLAMVLAGRCGALAHPSMLQDQAAAAAELWLLADEIGDSVLGFMGANWDFIGRLQMGDPVGADQALGALVDRAGDLRQPEPMWRLLRSQATDATISGDFVRAEQLARESFRVGSQAGFPDNMAYFGPQLFAIYFHQDRLVELEGLAERGARTDEVPPYLAGLALLYCELDLPDKARAVFERLMAPDLGATLTTYHAGVTLATATMTAHQLDDPHAAEWLHEHLAPYADACVSDSPYWWGSVRHHLGLAEATMGRFDAACESFEAAIAMHEQMGSPPWVALTQVEWARVLRRRGHRDGQERADELWQQAASAARTFGLGAVRRRMSACAPVA